MPAFKYTAIFNYTSGGTGSAVRRQGGWTESVYWDTFTPAILRNFRALLQARAALLPTDSAIIGFRVQQVDPSGPAQSGVANYPAVSGRAYQQDIPQMALLLRVRSDVVTNIRTFRIPALPDEQVIRGEYNPTGEYKVVVAAYLRTLSGWKFRGQDLTIPRVALTSVAGDGTYVTAADLAVAPGNRVRIFNVEDHDGNFQSGIYEVESAVSLRTGKFRNWPWGPTTGGLARRTVYIYPVITASETDISRVTTRKIGRPFGGYVGRRSARRRRRRVA